MCALVTYRRWDLNKELVQFYNKIVVNVSIKAIY